MRLVQTSSASSTTVSPAFSSNAPAVAPPSRISSESAAKRLEIPALVEVNLSGEETKSGVPESELDALIASYPDVKGLMTMPPETGDPEASRPYFRRLRELAVERDLAELSMGTSQDYRVAVEEGATLIRIGSVLYHG